MSRNPPYPFDHAGPSDWESPPLFEELRPTALASLAEEVHVWRASWCDLRAQRSDYESTLSASEHARAERYITEELTEQSILTHGWLREVLAGYLDRVPSDLEFRYGEHGKPSLSDAPLHFNVSHSASTIVIAATTRDEFGVDVEFEKEDRDLASLARRYFSADEVSRFECLPLDQQPAAFYRTWTRKEAYLKALGGGLTLPLDRFAVTLEPDASPALLWSDLDPTNHPGWWLASFRPAPDVAGAIIIPGQKIDVRFFEHT